jgi:hypothetical protein
MKKKIKFNNKSRYVHVTKEPLHIQELENDFIRTYRASLAPGVQTDFHRHSEDTIYIVLSGGTVSTELMKYSPECPTVLPLSFHLPAKLKWGVQRFFTGSLKLPAGFFFFMPS